MLKEGQPGRIFSYGLLVNESFACNIKYSQQIQSKATRCSNWKNRTRGRTDVILLENAERHCVFDPLDIQCHCACNLKRSYLLFSLIQTCKFDQALKFDCFDFYGAKNPHKCDH